MDEFIDQILSSSWGEMGGADRSSLDNSSGGPANCLSGSRVSTMTNMPLSCENLEGQAQSNDVQNSSTNVVVGGNTSHVLKRMLVNSQMQNHHEIQKPVMLSPTACETQNDRKTPVVGNIHGHESQESSHLTLQRHTECNTTRGSIALQLNTSGRVSPHGASPQGLPVGSAIKSAIEMPSSASGGTAGSDESGIHLCHADAYSPVSRQSHWSQSCIPGLSPVPRVLGQGKLKSIVLHREATEWEGLALGKRPREEEEMIEREKKCSTNVQGLDILHGTVLTNYIQPQVGQKPPMISGGTQSHQQMLQSGQGNSSHQHGNHSGISQPQSGTTAGTIVNGVARPRVRARRGQATDPHSIAERLRRERIAERMKALQELVPNSNKTDKASMLDEIIEYVKFLQLQVKVLSMSRLGGAGAVAPLIADISPEGAGGLMSTALGQAGGTLPLSQEGLAFEQEVVKLMESNMTTAMQYLQNKGLCLMPIALATAISSSSGKPLLAAVPRKGVDSSERQKSDMESTVLPFSSSSMAMGLRAAQSGTDAASKENPINNDIREEAVTDNLNGVVVRQSDVAKGGSQNREEPTRRGQ